MRTNYSKSRRRKTRLLLSVFIVLIVTMGGYVLWSNASPVLKPDILAVQSSPQMPPNPSLPWPGYGQSAIGAQGYGVLATSITNPQPLPTASVAKVMTALAILKAHPLTLGETGPNIPITGEDIESFNEYSARNGAVSKVVVGEQINQYQALQALLIRSSNNMADTLARWAYGSIAGYTAFADQYAKELGMSNTHFADTNGFSPQTVSTAEDLVKLGEAALNHPVIAEIVAQWEATIPEAGRIQNTNLFLDFHNNGVIGIKTGETEQAGGCYLVAAKYQLADGQTVTVIGAIMAAPSHFAAQQDMMPLLLAARAGFYTTTVIKAGQTIGQYNLPWAGTVDAIASREVSVLNWGNRHPLSKINLEPIRTPVDKSEHVGTIKFGPPDTSVPVTLKQSITAPTLGWRLRNLFSGFFN